MIKSANSIMYFVGDMKRSQVFYRDVLGLRPKNEHDEFSWYDLGNGFGLALHRSRGHVVGSTPVLALEVGDLAEARRTLQGAHAEIVRDFHEIPGGITLDCEDPDGHVLQLVQFTAKKG